MGTEEAPQEKPADGENAPKDTNADIYENRGTKKIVRLVTVLAYMFSVSFVAIVLSAYYLFLWEPPNPKLLRRPSRLIGSPEFQYLVNDPSNEQHPVNITFEQGNLESSMKEFSGRVVDDTPTHVADNHDHGTKNRSKLDDCFNLLRYSLMEYLRNRINDSRPDRNPAGKNWTAFDSAVYASLEKGRGSNMADNSSEEGASFGASSTNVVGSDKWILFAKIRNRGNDIPPILDSTIDPGETNNSIDSTVHGSYRDTYRSMENSTVYGENRKKDIPARPQVKVAIPENSIKIATETVENGRPNVETTRRANSNSFYGGFTDLVKAATIINKSDVIMTTRDKEDPETQRAEDNVYKVGFLVNNRSIVNSSRVLEFTDRLKSNLSSTKFANDAMNFRETQIEKITTKLVSPKNDKTKKPEVVATPETTPQQKDLLTILIATTEMSPSISPVTIQKDFPIDSSTTSNRETFTKRRPENTP